MPSAGAQVAFWDVDAPATLARVEGNSADPFRPLIPQYDFVFTYGGGPPVVEHYRKPGAKNCYPIYNGVDPDHHFPGCGRRADLACDLAFVGHRLPDREKRVEEFLSARGGSWRRKCSFFWAAKAGAARRCRTTYGGLGTWARSA